jgi:hypothetical protein
MKTVQELFDVLAVQGKAITAKREELRARGIDLPTWKIEILIQIQELKEKYYSLFKPKN